MKFLYMDETYADFSLPREAWSVCLTGMTVPADRHKHIRARYYDAVANALGRFPSMVPPLAEIHAAALLPTADDDTRIAFLEEVTSIIVEFGLDLYRVGYERSRPVFSAFKTDLAILGIAFNGLLQLLPTDTGESFWPVMETDNSKAQDNAFAGTVQFADHVEAHLGPEILSRSQAHIGEVLYSTKRSIYGSLVDCAAYLLNVRTLAARGLPLSEYKRRLNIVAGSLTPAIRFDEVISMRIEPAPQGYSSSGPYRYMWPISPSDG